MTDSRTLDHIEIETLLSRYGRAIDERDFDLLATVFTHDALIHYDMERGTRLEFPELSAWLEKALQIFRVTHHVITNPLIEIEADRARSTCYLTCTHVQVKLDGSEVLIVEGGVYSDLHVRTAEGWRIRQRTLRRSYVNGHYLGPDQVRTFPGPGRGLPRLGTGWSGLRVN